MTYFLVPASKETRNIESLSLGKTSQKLKSKILVRKSAF